MEYAVVYGIYGTSLYSAITRLAMRIPYLEYITFAANTLTHNYFYDIIAAMFFIIVFSMARVISIWAKIPAGNAVFASLQKSLVYIITFTLIAFAVEFIKFNIGDNQISFWLTFILATITVQSIIMTLIMETRIFLNYKTNGLSRTFISITAWILAAFFAYETGTNLTILTDPTFSIAFMVRIQAFFGVIGLVALPLSFFAVMMIASYFSYQYQTGNKDIDASQPKVILNGYWSNSEKQILLMGLLLFAGYIVRSNDRWILVPISFLVAIPIFWKFVISSPSTLLQLRFVENIVRSRRPQLLSLLAEDIALKRLQKQRDELLIKLANGKISPSDFDVTLETIEKDIRKLKKSSPLPEGISLRDVVLALGPEKTLFQNAVLGMKWAFWLHLPLLFFFTRFYLLESLSSSQLYLWLDTAIEFLSYSLRWLAVGFLIGFLFDFIRGNSGLRKALYFSAGVVLSLLPYRLAQTTSINDVSTFIFEMGQMAIFAILIGVAMDWETLRKNGYGFPFLRVVTSDIPSLVSVSSVIITTASVVITSILSGQLSQLLGSVVSAILPSMNSIPIPGIK